MSTTGRVVLAAALLASGCDDEGEDRAAPAPTKPPVVDETPAPEAREAIALDNGFVPDPHVVSGVAIGTRSAAELAEGCTGFVATEPDQVFEARGTFADLRILVDSEDDVTLLIGRPDDTYTCETSEGETGPVARGTFRPGTYRLWIAAPASSREVAYRLGISELEQPSW